MKQLFTKIWNFIKRIFGCQSCKDDCCDICGHSAQHCVLNAEHVTAMDREDMFMHYGDDYRFYETSITLKNFLNSPETSADIETITNVFQTVEERKTGYDTTVILIDHTTDGSDFAIKTGFWVGDMPINDEEIKLSFDDAYEQLMKANVVKPQSRKCVLRKELGPKLANPQYIFGNIREHVYVDAVTGDVRTSNPVYEGFEKDKAFSYAFPKPKKGKSKKKSSLNSPLGEWP